MMWSGKSNPNGHGSGRGLSREDLDAAIKQCRILVVDDVFLNRELISGYLEMGGFEHIEHAQDGVEALEKLESFAPDILVLDLSMPRMDGFQVCRHLRAQEAYKDLPILVQTGLDDPEQRVEAFAVGATDLVTKPLHRAELIARTRLHLERSILFRDLQAYQARIADELDHAWKMQQALLPTDAVITGIRERFGLEIAHHFAPSTELGGDFWGVRETEDGRLGLFIVDFSGHGVTAAINTFRLHGLIAELWRYAGDPAEFLGVLNERLERLLPVQQYATMLYGVFDPEREIFQYAAAAPVSPILREGKSGRVVVGDPKGFPLGVSASATYENRELPFPPGSLMFLYSDAMIAVERPDGRFSEEEDFEAFLRSQDGPVSPRAFLDRVLGTFYGWVRGKPDDDLTAICVAWPQD